MHDNLSGDLGSPQLRGVRDAAGVPALAFLHPDKHAVVYFFLDEYLFSVNVYDSAVVQFAGEPRGDVVEVIDGPLPINWRYVLAWVPRFKMVRNQLVLCLALLVSFFFPSSCPRVT